MGDAQVHDGEGMLGAGGGAVASSSTSSVTSSAVPSSTSSAVPWPTSSVTSSAVASLETLDHRGVDWRRVARVTFLLHQRYRYDYPGPVRDLRHRLVVVPPPWHGAQRRLWHRVDVAGAAALATARTDQFGNQLVDVRAPVVEEGIQFDAWVLARRHAAGGPARLPARALTDPAWLDPSPLTGADWAIRTTARRLAAGADGPLALAERLNGWVHQALSYGFGSTDVRTTAARALASGQGVCQDYAHVMLALCRAAGVAARYVSGHLLGEGGSHAWVEVLVADPGHPGAAFAVPFDPTHGRRAGITYLTVAVGRDYSDVAPTSGTFVAGWHGALSAGKRLGVTAVDLVPAAGPG